MARQLRFAFDVTCPYAFLASARVRALAEAAQAELEWFPVLLGGLYRDTGAPQGKDGSATDAVNAQRRALEAHDLRREYRRHGVEVVWNARHPQRSVHAMRLCVAAKPEQREAVARALFAAAWQEDQDITSSDVLSRIAREHGMSLDVTEDPSVKQALNDNTTWASSRGVFGVPAFFVGDASSSSGTSVEWRDDEWIFGGDRMHFVARALGLPPSHALAHPLRLFRTPPPPSRGETLYFYHDFSSPWSFLGSTQVARVARECNAKLEYKPILLGAVFRTIGAPNVPMMAISDAKRNYGARDMQMWKDYWGGVDLRFPDDFPLRTVLPLRVSIVEPKVVPHVYAAAWQQNKNVGDPGVLRQVLLDAGFVNADELIRGADDPNVKATLKNNTEEAVERGLCGVPSYRVRDECVWGQDRLAVVEDLLCGGAETGAPQSRM